MGPLRLTAGENSFGMHAIIAQHYFDGAAYPVGGARGSQRRSHHRSDAMADASSLAPRLARFFWKAAKRLACAWRMGESFALASC